MLFIKTSTNVRLVLMSAEIMQFAITLWVVIAVSVSPVMSWSRTSVFMWTHVYKACLQVEMAVVKMCPVFMVLLASSVNVIAALPLMENRALMQTNVIRVSITVTSSQPVPTRLLASNVPVWRAL